MNVPIVADPHYAPATLVEPSTLGFVQLAAEVSPSPIPIQLPSRTRAGAVRDLATLTRELELLDPVVRVTVFEARLIPPPDTSPESATPARFDLAVLVETTSVDTAGDLRGTDQYRAVEDALRARSRRLHAITARNTRRIADVDDSRRGLFLFNYFSGDPEVTVSLWEYLAGWYQAETGLTNSVLLEPVEGEDSEYCAINHARLNPPLPLFALRQLTKRSFRSYVLANLRAHHVASMPVLYRRA